LWKADSTLSNVILHITMRDRKMRLYVGGLSYQTTDEELTNFFTQVGQVVSARVIIDRETRRSKGFGFVEMSNDQEAQEAISRLDGTLLGGRTIAVNQARERPEERGYQNRERRPRYDNRSDSRDRRY
jgi:cold-inducible RNA-binding protein